MAREFDKLESGRPDMWGFYGVESVPLPRPDPRRLRPSALPPDLQFAMFAPGAQPGKPVPFAPGAGMFRLPNPSQVGPPTAGANATEGSPPAARPAEEASPGPAEELAKRWQEYFKKRGD